MNDKDPKLIEKILEYLYTGDYSPPFLVPDPVITQTDDEDTPEIDGQPPQEPSESTQTFDAERIVIDESRAHVDENSYEPVMETGVDIPGEPEQGPKLSGKRPTTTDGYPPTYVNEQKEEGNMIDAVVDTSVIHHPCYFHLRMYSEADYFMIDDLKKKLKKISANRFWILRKHYPFQRS